MLVIFADPGLHLQLFTLDLEVVHRVIELDLQLLEPLPLLNQLRIKLAMFQLQPPKIINHPHIPFHKLSMDRVQFVDLALIFKPSANFLSVCLFDCLDIFLEGFLYDLELLEGCGGVAELAAHEGLLVPVAGLEALEGLALALDLLAESLGVGLVLGGDLGHRVLELALAGHCQHAGVEPPGLLAQVRRDVGGQHRQQLLELAIEREAVCEHALVQSLAGLSSHPPRYQRLRVKPQLLQQMAIAPLPRPPNHQHIVQPFLQSRQPSVHRMLALDSQRLLARGVQAVLGFVHSRAAPVGKHVVPLEEGHRCFGQGLGGLACGCVRF